MWEPIDQEAVELARQEIKVRISQGAIRDLPPQSSADLTKTDDGIYSGYLIGTSEGHQKLVRIPGA